MDSSSIVGLTLALSLFTALVVTTVLVSFKINPFKSLLKPQTSWIILLLLQALYLSMDITETVTNRKLFGYLAAGFMFALGFVILFLIGLRKYIHDETPVIPHIIEGFFYLTIGIILLVVRLRESKSERKEEFVGKK